MSRAGKLILAAVIAVVVLAGGAYAFVASRGSDEPEPVTLDAPATSTGDGAATSDGTADGTWSVQKGENSYLGYRVQEKLAFLSPRTTRSAGPPRSPAPSPSRASRSARPRSRPTSASCAATRTAGTTRSASAAWSPSSSRRRSSS